MSADLVVRTRVLAALAVLAAASALLPMVDGSRWLVELAAVIALGAAVNIAVSIGSQAGFGSLAGLLTSGVAINLAYARDVSAAGALPTPTSVEKLGALLQVGAQTVYQFPAPLPDRPGVRALIVVGLTLAWWCTDALVGATRSPALAGVPLLAIVLPAAALSDGGVTAWSFGLAAGCYLVVMLGNEVVRAQEWGRLVPEGRGRPAGGTDGLAVGAAALVLALVIPTLIPGLSTRLVPQRGDGDGGDGLISVLNPVLDLHEDLTSQGNAVVLRYETTAPVPGPITVVSDDDFDGRMWQPTYGALDRDDRVQNGLPRAPGLAGDVATTPAQTTVTIEGLRQTWLPTVYPATRIDVSGNWLFDPVTLNVVGDRSRTDRGLTYTVSHDLVTPTPEQLQAAGPTLGAERWTALPADLSATIPDTARQVAGSGSHYDQALRLQNWLRSTGGFTYSEDAPPETGSGAISDFLVRRSGYCVHFASTMAVMARTLGIPSRVGVGFQAGQRVGDGSYEVRQRDAHAWPELYFDGVGWVRFEPTPASQAPVLPQWATPNVTAPEPAPIEQPAEVTPTPEATAAPSAPVEPPSTGLLSDLLARVPWPVVGLIAVLLLAAALPALVARGSRLVRWRSARAPDEAAEAAWEELLDDLDDLGVTTSQAATVREVAALLSADLPTQEQPVLAGLVEAVELARYGGGVATLERAEGEASNDDRRRDVRRVVTGLRSSRRRGSTWARIFPPSGVRRLRSARDRTLGWVARPLRRDRRK